MDMLHGKLFGKLLLFALPLAASSILQQLFNAVDVAVVGQFASSQEQAAVGCNGPVINLLINLFVGVSVGTNVAIANYIGQEHKERIHAAVHTSMVAAIVSGVLLLGAGMLAARSLLVWMDTPAEVLGYAVTYLRIYFWGMPFIMVYNFGAAILRSMGDTKRPLYCLVVSGVINAGLNMFLVIVFHLGAAGVAIATVISNVVSAAMVWRFLSHEAEPVRLSARELRVSVPELLRILQIGVPAGIQGMVFSIANVFVQSALNSLGTNAVAGSAVALNYEYFTYFVVAAFNQATVTFTSQNYGAKQYGRCKKIFWLCMAASVLATGDEPGFRRRKGIFRVFLYPRPGSRRVRQNTDAPYAEPEFHLCLLRNRRRGPARRRLFHDACADYHFRNLRCPYLVDLYGFCAGWQL